MPQRSYKKQLRETENEICVAIQAITYQTKTSQHRQALDTLQAQFQQRQGHNNEIENVPAFLEVVLRAHGHQFHAGLNRKSGREELQGIISFIFSTLSPLLLLPYLHSYHFSAPSPIPDSCRDDPWP